jgi:hypothetical protein
MANWVINRPINLDELKEKIIGREIGGITNTEIGPDWNVYLFLLFHF